MSNDYFDLSSDFVVDDFLSENPLYKPLEACAQELPTLVNPQLAVKEEEKNPYKDELDGIKS